MSLEDSIYRNSRECGSCNGYHPASFNGECRDNSMRFATPEEAAVANLELVQKEIPLADIEALIDISSQVDAFRDVMADQGITFKSEEEMESYARTTEGYTVGSMLRVQDWIEKLKKGTEGGN